MILDLRLMIGDCGLKRIRSKAREDVFLECSDRITACHGQRQIRCGEHRHGRCTPYSVMLVQSCQSAGFKYKKKSMLFAYEESRDQLYRNGLSLGIDLAKIGNVKEYSIKRKRKPWIVNRLEEEGRIVIKDGYMNV